MTRPIIFSCATLVLVWVSRSQLRRPDSHGFYRFVAWELMLAHWILVKPYGLRRWFIDPLSPLHLIAWCLLAGAAVLTAWPVYLLWVRGKARGGREDALLFPFEKTTELVVGGLYAFVRHPMYAGLLLATWGVLMLKVSWGGTALVVAATGAILLGVKAEEAENLRYFGTAYESYMRQSKRFIPWII
jgi:protein-S-isoprenylcysteine O-methyltransferase Ste14